jgi:molybdopterin-guanine dinucleotide biosynthesis protein B
MTKYIAVVGPKRSGKTTVIQQLIPALKRKGYKVATIKEMKNINTIDIPEAAKDTWKHSEAGAEIIVASPCEETVLFLKKKLSLNEIVPFLSEMDYIVLEGFEKEKVFPKIIAAKTAEEVASFSDGLVIALSGLVAETVEEKQKALNLQIPFFNIKTQAEELADLVEEKAFTMLPNLAGCTTCHPLGECGYPSCYEHAKAIVSGESKLRMCPLKAKENFVIEVNGVKLPLKDFPQKLVQNALIGMISSLHGGEKIKTLKIEMRENESL